MDPNFFVVYDKIEDEDLQILFWLERANLGSSIIVSPTMGLSDEDAVKFYENLLITNVWMQLDNKPMNDAKRVLVSIIRAESKKMESYFLHLYDHHN